MKVSLFLLGVFVAFTSVTSIGEPCWERPGHEEQGSSREVSRLEYTLGCGGGSNSCIRKFYRITEYRQFDGCGQYTGSFTRETPNGQYNSCEPCS